MKHIKFEIRSKTSQLNKHKICSIFNTDILNELKMYSKHNVG